MKLYKRGEIWHYAYSSPNGTGRVRKSSGTSDQQKALELAAREYDTSWRVAKLGERPEYTWIEAVVVWLNEKPERKENKNYDLIWLDKYLANKCISEIDRNLINFIKKEKQETGVKNRTVNGVLQQIRGVLNCAYENDMIDKVPAIKMLPEPPPRQVMLTPNQEKRLVDELPDHLIPIVLFALATGLRMSNITGLLWENVDIKNRHAWVNIGSGKVKTKGIGIPLNSVALYVLENLQGKHPTNVFTYKGNPIKRANSKEWRNARKRAGLPHLRFHDLRHVWASRHSMNGTHPHALQDLGAWSKADTVRRYAHLSSRHLLVASENALSESATNLTQRVLQ
ncbi:tyrosine-type recombinase/integrase [Gilliamella sp. Fer1-1]|uniref:tyrosine-type recombinase/integrase n=1 Tax=Gilliamella sp. Fer1-1 TaxID=3120240 RepID=UPI003FA587BB